jgi:hypothetical protein
MLSLFADRSKLRYGIFYKVPVKVDANFLKIILPGVTEKFKNVMQ